MVLANFSLVIISSHIWGDEGRGLIALILADISLITILNNISSGSTVSYHTPKTSKNKIFSVLLPLSFLTTFIGAVIFSFIQGFRYFQFLFLISLLISYTKGISSYWLGRKNIKLFNSFSISPPVSILIIVSAMYFLFNFTDINIYFYSYYIAYGIVAATGFYLLFRKDKFHFDFDKSIVKKMLYYGTKNETSYFIQFLNYRLSYFFISAWIGLDALGVFSVAVAISEAIWIISRSISSIHFSNIINTDNQTLKIKLTEQAAFNSFILSFFAMTVLFFTPDSLFVFVFGDDFAGVKQLIIYLFPGIIAIAVSNIYGHYFSGNGKMNVLITKSALGLITTTILIFTLLKQYKLTGACIILNAAYIISSLYLIIMFYKEKKKIKNNV